MYTSVLLFLFLFEVAFFSLPLLRKAFWSVRTSVWSVSLCDVSSASDLLRREEEEDSERDPLNLLFMGQKWAFVGYIPLNPPTNADY